jgi:hypothetical protein
VQLSSLSGDADFQNEEEAAFLASLVMSDASADNITITVSGGTVTQSAPGPSGSTVVSNFVNNVEGPIAYAIWEIMQTQEPGPETDPTNLLAAAPYVTLATNVYNDYMKSNGPAVQVFNSSVLIFIPSGDSAGTQRFFMGFGDTSSLTPEPGTLVLFGTGLLLMALGCSRRLARRPS